MGRHQASKHTTAGALRKEQAREKNEKGRISDAVETQRGRHGLPAPAPLPGNNRPGLVSGN